MRAIIPTAEKPKDKEGRRSLVPSAEFIRTFLLYESPKCRNCGRPLKSERSVKIGFGPTCAMDFAARWIRSTPGYLGERAKKIWTEDEIKKLIRYAKKVTEGK